MTCRGVGPAFSPMENPPRQSDLESRPEYSTVRVQWMRPLYFAVCGLCWMVAPGSHAGDTVEAYRGALRAGLDARVIGALDQIEGTGRQLLAARSYIRSAALLNERWSWDDAQIAAYADSPEKLRLDAAIAN